MIEVNVETLRVSLLSPERALLLKETDGERQLPIFIGAGEADAILTELQGYKKPPRPLTHDLLINCITELSGELKYVLINDLRDDIFFAVLHVNQRGRVVEIDARPSDSVALAVRARVPIFIDESVMEKASIHASQVAKFDSEEMSIFRDFVDSLDIDGLEEG